MKQEATPNVLQFHVHLIGISPMIWRRIQIQLTQTLGDLHAAIQLAFGWSGLSLHQFKRKGLVYRAVDREVLIAGQDSGNITLEQLNLSAGERFVYEYDFISEWCHQVRFEKAVVADSNVTTYPHCVAGARKSPREHIRGPSHFMELLAENSFVSLIERSVEIGVLDLIKNPTVAAVKRLQDDHFEEIGDMLFWLEREQFDRKPINLNLKQYSQGTPLSHLQGLRLS